VIVRPALDCSERLDQLEEGNAIGGHASEVEAIPRPAASPSAPRMTSRRFPAPWWRASDSQDEAMASVRLR
jgi:hypothetical protein